MTELSVKLPDGYDSAAVTEQLFAAAHQWPDRHKFQKWMRIADTVADEMSKDDTKVGAMLIGPDGETLLSGYNGPARGEDDEDPDVWGVNKNSLLSHAELNLIFTAARRHISTEGLTVVATMHPCARCAVGMQQAGVFRVITRPPVTTGRWSHNTVLAQQKMVQYGMELIYIN